MASVRLAGVCHPGINTALTTHVASYRFNPDLDRVADALAP